MSTFTSGVYTVWLSCRSEHFRNILEKVFSYGRPFAISKQTASASTISSERSVANDLQASLTLLSLLAAAALLNYSIL